MILTRIRGYVFNDINDICVQCDNRLFSGCKRGLLDSDSMRSPRALSPVGGFFFWGGGTVGTRLLEREYVGR